MFQFLSLSIDNYTQEVVRVAESKSARPKSMHRLCSANVLSDRYDWSQLIKSTAVCVLKLITTDYSHDYQAQRRPMNLIPLQKLNSNRGPRK